MTVADAAFDHVAGAELPCWMTEDNPVNVIELQYLSGRARYLPQSPRLGGAAATFSRSTASPRSQVGSAVS